MLDKILTRLALGGSMGCGHAVFAKDFLVGNAGLEKDRLGLGLQRRRLKNKGDDER